MEPVTPSKRKGAPAPEEPTEVVRVGDDTRVIAGDFELAPGQTLGEYRIEKLLGRGGMGDVFAGVHPKIGKRVAIKVIKKDLCNEFNVQRFVDEARIVNEIGHPNIIDIFAFGEMPDGRSYFVMEQLVGETLRERIAKGAMSAEDTCAILKPLTRALEAAHAKGVIHRDLKPDNVFLVELPGEPPRVKLLDFGIAKLAKADHRVEQTKSGVMVGTPQYIAPEQAKGHTVDTRADIYALGCIAYEMLTGRPPFVADNAMEMVAKHLMEPVVSPSSLVAMPADLDTMVVAMLAKEPDGRPSLPEVAVMIERVLERKKLSLEDAPTGSQPVIRRMPTPPPVRHPTPVPIPGMQTPLPASAPPAGAVGLSELYPAASGGYTAAEPLPVVDPIGVDSAIVPTARRMPASRGKYILLGVIVLATTMSVSFFVMRWLQSNKGEAAAVAVAADAAPATDATEVAVTPIEGAPADGAEPSVAVPVDAEDIEVPADAAQPEIADAAVEPAVVVVDAAVAVPDAPLKIRDPKINRRPERPPPPRRGTIHVVVRDASPSKGATIFLDNKVVGRGKTALSLAVELGRTYRIRIESEGRRAQTFSITPRTPTTRRTVKLDLALMAPGGGAQ